MPVPLPARMRVIVRDWVNANHILFDDDDGAVLVDSGHVSGRDRTLQLLDAALAGRPLRLVANTHCHSDHMGGNAALQRRYGARIAIPSGEAARIARWDERELWLKFAGQTAEPFQADEIIEPDTLVRWGGQEWRTIAAPGHDDGALMFYCEAERLLISGDALWEHGFGVVLPEPPQNFDDARATLERIGALDIRAVIPGHGCPFSDAKGALTRAHARLDALVASPQRGARSVLKTMLAYELLTGARFGLEALPDHLDGIEIYREYRTKYLGCSAAELASALVCELVRADAGRVVAGELVAG